MIENWIPALVYLSSFSRSGLKSCVLLSLYKTISPDNNVFPRSWSGMRAVRNFLFLSSGYLIFGIILSFQSRDYVQAGSQPGDWEPEDNVYKYRKYIDNYNFHRLFNKKFTGNREKDAGTVNFTL